MRTAWGWAGAWFDNVTKDYRDLQAKRFGPVLSVRARVDYGRSWRCRPIMITATQSRFLLRDGKPRDFAAKVNAGMVGINVPIPVPIAYYTRRLEEPASATFNQHVFDPIPLLYQDQDRDGALALRRQGRRGVLDSNDELTSA